MIKWHNFAQEILYEDCFVLSTVTWGMQYAEVHHDLSSKYACYLHKAFDDTNCTYLITYTENSDKNNNVLKHYTSDSAAVHLSVDYSQ